MITNIKNQEELKKQQVMPAGAQQQNAQQPIQVMQGVTEGTRQKLQQAQAGYQPTQEAAAANQALQSLQAQKPQGYTSKYSGQLEGILNELQGKKFSYDLNGDAFFQSMKDTQTQLAKQAAMDTMGMAAGLTGGYGNSAAQAVANQAFQQALLPLYDRGMDAYNLALQRFQIEQQGMGDQFNRLAQLEGQDYGRYRDTVGDWERERDYLTGRADVETERGREDWRYNLDYLTQLAQIENADYRNEQERQEAIRQFEAQYALQQEQLRWQQEADQRNYDRGVLESDRDFDRRAMESDRNFDRSVMESDRDYERAMEQLRWQQEADQRNYDRDVLVSDRDYDRGVRESDRAYDRGVLESDRAYEQALEQLRWQQNTDQRNFDRDVLESDRGYDFQKKQFGWQQEVDKRDYDRSVLESDRAYDLQKNQQDWQKEVNQRDYDRSVTESDRAYELQKAQMDENTRQFNESLNWDKMTADQKYNAELAMAILQNGQMPSDEILAAAGLSAEDAQKLMAQMETTGGGGGGTGSGKKPTYYVDIAGNYYTTDKNGNYVPVSKKDVDPNGLEDRSKILDITSKNLANTWTDASQAQADQKAKAQENATRLEQQRTADQASKENQEKLKKIMKGFKGFTNPWG